MILKAYIDGGARGNPGPAAIGALIINSRDQKLVEFSERIGWATNNQAEYQAIIKVLAWLKDNQTKLDQKVDKMIVCSDSKLVVNQLNGFYKIKNGIIREFVVKIRNLEAQCFTPIIYQYVPRIKNRLADALVNKALD